MVQAKEYAERARDAYIHANEATMVGDEVAIRYFDEAIKLDTAWIDLVPCASAYWNRAQAYQGKFVFKAGCAARDGAQITFDDLERAVVDLQSSLKQNPSQPDCYAQLGFNYTLLSKFDDARKNYQEALNLLNKGARNREILFSADRVKILLDALPEKKQAKDFY